MWDIGRELLQPDNILPGILHVPRPVERLCAVLQLHPTGLPERKLRLAVRHLWRLDLVRHLPAVVWADGRELLQPRWIVSRWLQLPRSIDGLPDLLPTWSILRRGWRQLLQPGRIVSCGLQRPG